MKTTTLSTPTHEILLVELPEKAREPKIFNDKDRPYISYFDGFETPRFYLPEGDWKELGFVTDLKESEIKNYTHPISVGETVKYVTSQEDYHKNNLFDTALESFLSLLETKIHFENPVKVHTWASENADEYRKQFEDAQSRTFDKERTIVFVKER